MNYLVVEKDVDEMDEDVDEMDEDVDETYDYFYILKNGKIENKIYRDFR